MFDRSTGEAYLTAQLSKDFTHKSFLKKLPPSFILDTNAEKPPAIRSKATRKIAGPNLTTPADIRALQSLNKELRTDLQYIAGSQTLWYVKAIESGPKRLSRSPLTITLAVMHRLSEICRYQPLELAAFLRGQRNWLLSEFVLMAPEQFLDGIASELTGHQFLLPNVRQPA